MKKINIFDVENCIENELTKTKFIKNLQKDEDFKATMVQLYNEYIDEMEYIGEDPQCELIDFIIDKMEWLENNTN